MDVIRRKIMSKLVRDTNLLENLRYDTKKMRELMTRYRCAMMEVETKL